MTTTTTATATMTLMMGGDCVARDPYSLMNEDNNRAPYVHQLSIVLFVSQL